MLAVFEDAQQNGVDVIELPQCLQQQLSALLPITAEEDAEDGLEDRVGTGECGEGEGVKGEVEVVYVLLEVEFVIAPVVSLALQEQFDRIGEDGPPNEDEVQMKPAQRNLSPMAPFQPLQRFTNYYCYLVHVFL